MFERVSNGWSLTMASWDVLKLDKKLLVFPLLSGIACLIVLASFALPLMGSDYVQTVRQENTPPQDPVAYVILFLFYFVNYFVILFFNSALIACAVIRFRGEAPTLGDGFRAATARLPQIAAWAAVSATVGVILKLIESRSERAGKFAASLLGMAWSAATYFVLPVIVIEQTGPLDAFRRSLAVLRKSWGEALVANFGIGLIVFGAVVISLIPAILGVLSGNVAVIISCVVVSAMLVVLVSLMSSCLNVIVIGALYEYATEGKSPPQFDEATIRHAFAPQ